MKNNASKNDLSRRDFVRTTAVGLGGIGASALAGTSGVEGSPRASNDAEAQTAEIPKRWDRAADVVVIGAGAAGLPAAIEAAEHRS